MIQHESRQVTWSPNLSTTRISCQQQHKSTNRMVEISNNNQFVDRSNIDTIQIRRVDYPISTEGNSRDDVDDEPEPDVDDDDDDDEGQTLNRSTLLVVDYSSSIIYTKANNLIKQVEAIEGISRRSRQESNAIEAVDDLMTAPLDCLEGLRAMPQRYDDKNDESGRRNIDFDDNNNDNQTNEGALADDLSSCADDETPSPQSQQLNHQDKNKNACTPSSMREEIDQLNERIRACYQAVISIQASADLRERRLELEIMKLQSELEIERCHNSKLNIQLERLRKQYNHYDDTIDADCLAVETHLNKLVLRCEKYLAENLSPKQTLHERTRLKGLSLQSPSFDRIYRRGSSASLDVSPSQASLKNTSSVESEQATTAKSPPNNDPILQKLNTPSPQQNAVSTPRTRRNAIVRNIEPPKFFDVESDESPIVVTRKAASITTPIRRPTYHSLTQKVLRGYLSTSPAPSSSNTPTTNNNNKGIIGKGKFSSSHSDSDHTTTTASTVTFANDC